MSKLLLNEQPLLIMPTLASKIGLNEAIVLQQIHYWNDINEKANNNFRDGYYWTFNSYDKWNKQFPFWSSRTIQRTIKKLEDLKLVVAGNYNKLKIDRTKWYRIDYNVLKELETSPFGQNGTINMTDWLNHLDNVGLPLPETNSEINSETNESYLHNPEDCGCFLHPYKIDDNFVQSYLAIMDVYIPKGHKRIREANKDYILNGISVLKDWGITLDEWEEKSHEHFQNLPKSNDGDIIAFLSASKRYFEVDVNYELSR